MRLHSMSANATASSGNPFVLAGPSLNVSNCLYTGLDASKAQDRAQSRGRLMRGRPEQEAGSPRARSASPLDGMTPIARPYSGTQNGSKIALPVLENSPSKLLNGSPKKKSKTGVMAIPKKGNFSNRMKFAVAMNTAPDFSVQGQAPEGKWG